MDRWDELKEKFDRLPADTVATMGVQQEDIALILVEHTEVDDIRHEELMTKLGAVLQQLEMSEVNRKNSEASQKRENKRIWKAFNNHCDKPPSQTHEPEPPSRAQQVLGDRRFQGGTIGGTILSVILVIAGWLGFGGGGG